MTSRRPPWYAAVLLTLAGAIASGVSGYYASGAGSSADQVKENEHRLTQVEDSIVAHSQADALERSDVRQQIANLWCAVRVNHGEACRP